MATIRWTVLLGVMLALRAEDVGAQNGALWRTVAVSRQTLPNAPGALVA